MDICGAVEEDKTLQCSSFTFLLESYLLIHHIHAINLQNYVFVAPNGMGQNGSGNIHTTDQCKGMHGGKGK